MSAFPSPPMARLATKLDRLFQTVHPPQREYTYREVAEGIEQRVGWTTSPTYVQELRTGRRTNPSMKHLEGLAAFFGVPVGYFFSEELAALVDAQLELATALRDVPVRHIALRAAGLSDEALSNIAQIIEHVRHLEGLDDTPHRKADPRLSPSPE